MINFGPSEGAYPEESSYISHDIARIRARWRSVILILGLGLVRVRVRCYGNLLIDSLVYGLAIIAVHVCANISPHQFSLQQWWSHKQPANGFLSCTSFSQPITALAVIGQLMCMFKHISVVNNKEVSICQ